MTATRVEKPIGVARFPIQSSPAATSNAYRARWLYPALAFLISFILAAPVTAGEPYLDPQGRFAIVVDDNWVAQPTDTPGVVAAWVPQGGGAIFSVTHDPVPDTIDSGEYARIILGVVATYPGFLQLDGRVLTVAGRPAPLLDYTITDAGGPQRVQQVFLVQGNDAWTLTFRTRLADAALYSDAASAMIASFAI